ncbi:UNVERIFIED_ORG: hypothetical protein ABID57_003233 [Arthrobacter sp. UYEF1]
MAYWARTDPDLVMKAPESDCKVEKLFTVGPGHIAHSVNDMKEVTRAAKHRPSTQGDSRPQRPPTKRALEGTSTEKFVHTQGQKTLLTCGDTVLEVGLDVTRGMLEAGGPQAVNTTNVADLA